MAQATVRYRAPVNEQRTDLQKECRTLERKKGVAFDMSGGKTKRAKGSDI